MKLFDRPKAVMDAVSTGPDRIAMAIAGLTIAVLFLGVAILMTADMGR